MMMNIFHRLNDNSVSYVVWKDTKKTNDFFHGNNELDLLVDEQSRTLFENIIKEQNFIRLKVRLFLNKEGIEHYIKYDNGKYFHLHVYYRLRTGNHFVKEYCFNVEQSIFSNSILVNGIKVVSKIDELALLIIRLSIKQSFIFSSIKQGELNRLKVLIDSERVDETGTVLTKYINVIKCDFSGVFDSVNDDKALLEKLRGIKKHFKQNRIMSVLVFYSTYLFSRGYLLLLRLKRNSNKTLKSNGASIAILGTDGSGKSTIVNKMSKLLSAKTSSKAFYLGGNKKTYSLRTRFFYYIYNILRVFSPLKDKYYLAWFLYNVGLCTLEYNKALDRKNLVHRGELYKSRGWIIIYERFPVIGLFDFPNKIYSHKNEKWLDLRLGKHVARMLTKIAHTIESIPTPDITFLLTVDFDTMIERRKMKENEIIDIKNKLAIQKQFLKQENNQFFVVDNNGDFNQAIELITNKVNIQLCKSN